MTIEPHDETVAPADAPASSSPTEAVQSSSGDQLDGLLAEYDNAVGRRASSEPAPSEASTDDLFGDVEIDQAAVQAELVERRLQAAISDREQRYLVEQQQSAEKHATDAIAVAERDRTIGQYRDALDQARHQLQQFQAEQAAAADHAARVQFVSERAAELEEFKNLPGGAKDWADRFLTAEYLSDPKLQIAWQHRNTPAAAVDAEIARTVAAINAKARNPLAFPETLEQLEQYRAELQIVKSAQAYLRGVGKKLYKVAAEANIDRGATEDRASIVSAMMRQGSNGGPIPESAPRDLSRLSTQEFRQALQEDYNIQSVV